jgi:hypothetical protein
MGEDTTYSIMRERGESQGASGVGNFKGGASKDQRHGRYQLVCIVYIHTCIPTYVYFPRNNLEKQSA